MGADVEVKVTGLKELNDSLMQFTADVQDRMIRDALRAGGEVIRAEAIRMAPRERGLSSPKSIVSRIKLSVRKPDRFGVLGRIVAGAPHSHLIEFGTKAHRIVAKNKKVLAAKLKSGFDVFGRVVNHPGNSARPFMRPAFEAKKSDAVQAMADSLHASIAKFKAKKAG